jgi:flagellar basal-body rod modification protein FlgD
MATSTQAIGSALTSATSKSGMSGVSGEDFMSILIKQLQMQDPFQPMTNQEMISQMSTIRELEMNTQLTDKLSQLTDQQRFGSAAALIGKHVKGTVSDSSGNDYEVDGVVAGIEFTKTGDVVLQLESGDKLPISGLTEVTQDASGVQASQASAKSVAKTLR